MDVICVPTDKPVIQLMARDADDIPRRSTGDRLIHVFLSSQKITILWRPTAVRVLRHAEINVRRDDESITSPLAGEGTEVTVMARVACAI